MDSLTLIFTGRENVLRSYFMPELVLEENCKYGLALIDFTSYNSIPNITEEKNNKFYIKYTVTETVKFKTDGKDTTTTVHKDKEKKISFFTGAYEVVDILSYIKSQLASSKINLAYDINAATSKIKLVFDTTIHCTDISVLNILGFGDIKTFEKGKDYYNEHIVKITNIDIIRINCNIISDSYLNGKECQTIYSFSHCKVSVGRKFIETPQHIIYSKIKEKRIQCIELSVVDQEGVPIDFRGEQISCRVHIKKL